MSVVISIGIVFGVATASAAAVGFVGTRHARAGGLSRPINAIAASVRTASASVDQRGRVDVVAQFEREDQRRLTLRLGRLGALDPDGVLVMRRAVRAPDHYALLAVRPPVAPGERDPVAPRVGQARRNGPLDDGARLLLVAPVDVAADEEGLVHRAKRRRRCGQTLGHQQPARKPGAANTILITTTIVIYGISTSTCVRLSRRLRRATGSERRCGERLTRELSSYSI